MHVTLNDFIANSCVYLCASAFRVLFLNVKVNLCAACLVSFLDWHVWSPFWTGMSVFKTLHSHHHWSGEPVTFKFVIASQCKNVGVTNIPGLLNCEFSAREFINQICTWPQSLASDFYRQGHIVMEVVWTLLAFYLCWGIARPSLPRNWRLVTFIAFSTIKVWAFR